MLRTPVRWGRRWGGRDVHTMLLQYGPPAGDFRAWITRSVMSASRNLSGCRLLCMAVERVWRGRRRRSAAPNCHGSRKGLVSAQRAGSAACRLAVGCANTAVGVTARPRVASGGCHRTVRPWRGAFSISAIPLCRADPAAGASPMSAVHDGAAVDIGRIRRRLRVAAMPGLKDVRRRVRSRRAQAP